MTPQEIINKCDEQIQISGEKANVGFVIQGRWEKQILGDCGRDEPKGEIVQDFGNGTIYVMFSAIEVKEAVYKDFGITP